MSELHPKDSVLAECPDGFTNRQKWAAFEWLRGEAADGGIHARVAFAEWARLAKIAGEIPVQKPTDAKAVR